jgi:hypothetical protein
MDGGKGKKYCIVDHANKQKELARWTPYEFWVSQVKRRKPADTGGSIIEVTSRRDRRTAK